MKDAPILKFHLLILVQQLRTFESINVSNTNVLLDLVAFEQLLMADVRLRPQVWYFCRLKCSALYSSVIKWQTLWKQLKVRTVPMMCIIKMERLSSSPGCNYTERPTALYVKEILIAGWLLLASS